MISSSFNSAQFSQSLVDAERIGRDQINSSKLSSYKSQLSAYKSLEGNLESLMTKLNNIGSETFEAKTVVVTGDEATVTVGAKAPLGSYKLTVSQMAQADQQTKSFGSEDELLATTGVLAIQLGADPLDTISIDLSVVNAAGDKTVADLRDIINKSTDNPGVQASLIRTGTSVELMLTSEKTGVANSLDITLDGADWGTTQLRTAQDAQATLNGVTISSSTNYLKDVIDGVSVEINQVHSADDSSQINITADTDTSKKAVTEFVDSFNTLLGQMKSLIRGRANDADDSTSKTVGALNGDSSLRMLEGRIKNVLFETAPNGMRLADIGIELDGKGSLKIDDAKLTEALKNDAESLQALFTADDGYIDKLEAVIDPYTEYDGYLDNREKNLETQSDRVKYDIEQYNNQMKQRYQLYLAQFTAMEATINSLSSASSLFSSGGST